MIFDGDLEFPGFGKYLFWKIWVCSFDFVVVRQQRIPCCSNNREFFIIQKSEKTRSYEQKNESLRIFRWSFLLLSGQKRGDFMFWEKSQMQKSANKKCRTKKNESLRIFRWPFWVLNGRKRGDSVFFEKPNVPPHSRTHDHIAGFFMTFPLFFSIFLDLCKSILGQKATQKP